MKNVLLSGAVAMALVAVAPPAAWSQDPAQPEPSATSAPSAAVVGKPAPEIQIADWIGGDGRATLADFRGEVVLLEFWATHCPASRGQVAHLSRLQSDYAKKGLVVIGITGEDRKLVTQYLAHADAGFSYRIGLGGASGYPSPGIPYAALIAADGTVAWLGEPGGISTKTIDLLVKKIPKATPETDEARAARMLASAEALVATKDLLRAETILQKAAARYAATESGKKAAARVRDFSVGEFAAEIAAELAAQRDLAKLLGGSIEKPAEADSKRMEKVAKVFEKKAAEWKDAAPRAAALALFWRDVASETWQDAVKKTR